MCAGYIESRLLPAKLGDEVLRYLAEQQQALRTRFGHPDEFAQLVHTLITSPMANGEVVRLDAGMRQLHWPLAQMRKDKEAT